MFGLQPPRHISTLPSEPVRSQVEQQGTVILCTGDILKQHKGARRRRVIVSTVRLPSPLVPEWSRLTERDCP
jgi:hypothetical protein